MLLFFHTPHHRLGNQIMKKKQGKNYHGDDIKSKARHVHGSKNKELQMSPTVMQEKLFGNFSALHTLIIYEDKSLL